MKKNKKNNPMRIIGPAIITGLLFVGAFEAVDSDIAWMIFGLAAFFLVGTIFNIKEMMTDTNSPEEYLKKCEELKQSLHNLDSLTIDEKKKLRVSIANLPREEQQLLIKSFSTDDHFAFLKLVNETDSEKER